MNWTEAPSDRSVTDLPGDTEAANEENKPEIEPESWRDLTEFVDQFDDAVFGVFGDPENGAEGFWIVNEIKKVRPAAVPIDQGPTFDMDVLGPGGEVVDKIRLTIDEIEHVRASEPSGVYTEEENRG
jgi:hypothetical protein